MKKIMYLIAAVMALFVASCSKDDNHKLENLPSIYISGTDFSNSAVSRAMYWKDGEAIFLSDGTHKAGANSIFVVNGDVYVAGYEVNESGVCIARYWRNGVAIDLNSGGGSAVANSIYVSNGDVYVCGDINGWEATLWTNGVRKTFVPSGNFRKYSMAESVFVSGNDVYVAGRTTDRLQIPVMATLWKNDIGRILISTQYDPALLHSVYVNGQDVYVCGNIGSGAFYYKNNSFIGLADSSAPVSALAICCANDLVYVAGTSSNKAVYWKDRNITRLQSNAPSSTASSIAVSGTDVYIAGYDKDANGRQIAKFWLNEIPVMLGNEQSNTIATGIVVVP